jgi:hypothetical protein
MYRRLQYGNWVPGAVVRVYSKRYNVWHFGIAGWVVGTVLHASKELGRFTLTTYDEFVEAEVAGYTWLPESFEKQQEVLSRAESRLGSPFRLLNANCEDYVNEIVAGIARSPQRDHAAMAALIAALIIGGMGGFGGTLVRR